MATDIYLSKATHEAYGVSFWHDCTYGIGEIEITHKPCGNVIFEADQGDVSHWAFMEAMSKHNRACPAGRSNKPEPGLHIPESEIRRK